MFYDKFVYLCKQKGVSPSRAAIDAGISKSLVTKWKTNNIQDPSAEVARKLAVYFNVSVAELLGEDNKTPTVSGERDPIDDVDLAFYGEYKELSDDDKETVRDMVRVMRQRRAAKERNG